MNANEIYNKRVELDKQQFKIFNDMKLFILKKLKNKNGVQLNDAEYYALEDGRYVKCIYSRDNNLIFVFDDGNEGDITGFSYEDMCQVFEAFCDTIGEQFSKF